MNKHRRARVPGRLPGPVALFLCAGFLGMNHDAAAQRTEPAPVTSDATTPGDIFADRFGVGEAAQAPSYVIQANDVLRVFVFDEEELSGQVLVRPDGRISVPLVQDLQAAGMTPAMLKREIERKLAAYVEVPNVTVIVEAIQSYRVFVMGQVNQPGDVMNEKAITVLQAISMAGGFTDFARKNEILIMRSDGNGDMHRFEFDYERLIKSDNAVQNFLLQSGDVVVVP